VALAGGIGAGKTVASEHLVTRGWTVIDADVVARKVVAKGEPAWVALRDAFGSAVLDANGELDRKFVAEIVFHDASALRRINRITHGHIGREIADELDATSGEVVFVAIPLFRPEHREIFHLTAVWSIQVSPATALTRLTKERGYSKDDAQARLASQITNEEREAIVDRVIWNEGTIEELFDEIDRALAELGVEND
jgi:dephospho-CoA kinase